MNKIPKRIKEINTSAKIPIYNSQPGKPDILLDKLIGFESFMKI